jgi:hypothetical protein
MKVEIQLITRNFWRTNASMVPDQQPRYHLSRGTSDSSGVCSARVYLSGGREVELACGMTLVSTALIQAQLKPVFSKQKKSHPKGGIFIVQTIKAI